MCDFSQGPWSTTFNGRWYGLNDANEDWIADTCASSCKGDLALGEANAHLIAAAPEMYEMLSELSKHNYFKEQLPFSYDKVLETLSKARGEHV